jgi:hypothetical protein
MPRTALNSIHCFIGATNQFTIRRFIERASTTTFAPVAALIVSAASNTQEHPP